VSFCQDFVGSLCSPTPPHAARPQYRPRADLRVVEWAMAHSSCYQNARASDLRRVRGPEGKHGAKSPLPRALALSCRSQHPSCNTSTVIYRLLTGSSHTAQLHQWLLELNPRKKATLHPATVEASTNHDQNSISAGAPFPPSLHHRSPL